jgi:hypothetical protein
MADRRLFCHAGRCIIMMDGGERDAGGTAPQARFLFMDRRTRTVAL